MGVDIWAEDYFNDYSECGGGCNRTEMRTLLALGNRCWLARRGPAHLRPLREGSAGPTPGLVAATEDQIHLPLKPGKDHESRNTLKALVLRRNTAGSSRGPNRAVVLKPIGEANRCNLRHVTPKTPQKALYVGFSQIGRPLQVVGFGWSQFPVPEARLAG